VARAINYNVHHNLTHLRQLIVRTVPNHI